MVIQSSRSQGCPVCSNFTKHALKKNNINNYDNNDGNKNNSENHPWRPQGCESFQVRGSSALMTTS